MENPFPKVNRKNLEENQFVLDTLQSTIFQVIVPEAPSCTKVLRCIVSLGSVAINDEVPVSLHWGDNYYDLGFNKPYSIIQKLLRWKRRNHKQFDVRGLRII